MSESIRIEIKNRFTGEVIFAHECEGNTIKNTVEQAVKEGVSLYGASLDGASLNGASLSRASLNRASLDGASLEGASGNFFVPLACPSDGAFVGWKKVNKKLVKLIVPSGAKRSSATSRKCRAEFVEVIEITDLDGNNPIEEITNTSRPPHTLYKVGEITKSDSWDENRFNECSHGIHFFINKQEAIDYEL